MLLPTPRELPYLRRFFNDWMGPLEGIAVVALLVTFMPRDAGAQGTTFWQEDGVPVCVEPALQYGVVTVSDGSGGAIFAWLDMRSSSNNQYGQVYVQRVNAVGEIQWSSDGIPLSDVTASPEDSFSEDPIAIASDGSGGAIVTWQDGRDAGNHDIYAQRVSSGGIPQWTANGVRLCQGSAIGTFSDPTIAPDGASGAIVAWIDHREPDADIYAQRVTANGNPAWRLNGVAIASVAGSEQRRPEIVSDGSGGAVIAWLDGRFGGHVYIQRVNASGRPQWARNGVAVTHQQISYVSVYQGRIAMASDGSGGAVLAWSDHRNCNPSCVSGIDIYAQRVAGSGVPQWNSNGVPICTAPRDQGGQARAHLNVVASGSLYIVSWTDSRTAYYAEVFAQSVNSSGVSQWAVDGVLCHEGSGAYLVADNLGGAIVASRTWTQASGNQVLAQRLGADGSLRWGASGVNVSGTPIDMVADQAGGAIISYFPSSSGFSDIYAQRVGDCGVVGSSGSKRSSISVDDCCQDAEPLLWIGTSGVFDHGSNWNGGGPPTGESRLLFTEASGPGKILTFTSSPTTKDLEVRSTQLKLELEASQTLTLRPFIACDTSSRSLVVGGATGENASLWIAGGRVLADDAVTFSPATLASASGGESTVIVSGNGELVVDDDQDGDDLQLGGDGPTITTSTLHLDNGRLRTKGFALIAPGSGSEGLVQVTGPSAFWLGGLVQLGIQGRGELLLESAGKATLGSMLLASTASSQGTITVTGNDSKLIASNISFGSGSSEIVVAAGGRIDAQSIDALRGNIHVRDALTSVLDVNGQVAVGLGGQLLIGGMTGPRGGLASINSLIIGSSGAGLVKVQNGGLLSCGSALLSPGSTTNAVVDISGSASQWYVASELLVSGDGLITISDGAYSEWQSGRLAVDPGADVTLNITGGNSQLRMSGFGFGGPLVLGVGGSAALIASAGAKIEASSLTVGPHSPPPNLGTGTVLVGPSAAYKVTARAGVQREDVLRTTLRTDTLILGDGTSIVADSVLLADGGVIKGGGTIHVPLVNEGILSPGSESAVGVFVVATDYSQSSTGHLRISIADSTSDQLHVSGAAVLGGSLEFDVLPGSAPSNGRQLEILRGYPVVGTFDQVQGYGAVAYTDTSVVLTISTSGITTPDTRLLPRLLLQLATNPVLETARIEYEIPEAGRVSMRIFDVSGRVVHTIVDAEDRLAGRHEVAWNGQDASGRRVNSGVYFVRLESGGQLAMARIVLLR
jgi:hypothetical protein